MEKGTHVRHPDTGEVGIVVHSWHNDEIDAEDNYIVFFGTEFPNGAPSQVPYVLRYATPGLEVLAAPD